MTNRPQYNYRIGFSAMDNEYVATCAEVPGLSGLGATPQEAMVELETALEGWLEYLASEGLPIPDRDIDERAGGGAGDASRIHCDRDGPVPAAPPDPASVSGIRECGADSAIGTPETGAEVEWSVLLPIGGRLIYRSEGSARRVVAYRHSVDKGGRLQSRVCGPWRDVETPEGQEE